MAKLKEVLSSIKDEQDPNQLYFNTINMEKLDEARATINSLLDGVEEFAVIMNDNATTGSRMSHTNASRMVALFIEELQKRVACLDIVVPGDPYEK